jgi:hypothetical protein
MVGMRDIVYPSTPFPLQESLILAGLRGSEAHGTYIGDQSHDGVDDRDVMGVVIPPKDYYLGLRSWEVAEAINAPWDVVLYELRKFVRLLMKQNPNVLQLLWIEDEDYLPLPRGQRWFGQLLVYERLLFRSGPMAHTTFIGYAKDQLKRATAFNAPAMQQIADLEDRLTDLGVDLASAAEGKWDRQRSIEINTLCERYVGMRRTYHKAYMGAKRWAMVRRFGYDPKNAAHLIRLLHLGYEYLTTGRMQVRRTWDREMLIEIKTGQWPLDAVKAHAETWFARVDGAASVLPESIDADRVNDLVVGMVEDFHRTSSASRST